MNSKASKLLTLNFVLFLLVAALAGYMVWQHYTLINGDAGFGSFCSISDKVDCDAVNGSEYAELAGVPLATLGLAYYLLAAILSLIGARNSYSRREVLLTLAPLALTSVFATIGTFAITALILKKFCIMCIAMHIFNISTFIVTLLALRDFTGTNGLRREFGEARHKKIVGYLGLGVAILLVSQGLSSQLKEVRMPLDDAEKYVNEFRAQPVQDIEVGDSPVQGLQSPNPPVRVIEFADFQCPACGFAAKQMHHLLKIYGDRMQLVFKNFPLDPSCNNYVKANVHQFACLSAKAAYCARKQGKFQEMYEKLFANQREISRSNIMLWAQEMNLDLTAFDACIPDAATEAALKLEIEQAVKAGLESTPTFFINGRMVKGAIDEVRMKLLLRELGQ